MTKTASASSLASDFFAPLPVVALQPRSSSGHPGPDSSSSSQQLGSLQDRPPLRLQSVERLVERQKRKGQDAPHGVNPGLGLLLTGAVGWLLHKGTVGP
jgi:hypothetical protein